MSHMSLAGTVVASSSLTQVVAGSNPFTAFTVMTNIFVTEFNETFRKIALKAINVLHPK